MNKTNFNIKGFALGLALKQRRNATGKSPILGRLMSSVWHFSAQITDTSLEGLRRHPT